MKKEKLICKVKDICGACQYRDFSYEQQLDIKQQEVTRLYKKYKVHNIIGTDNPYHYRNKVQVSFEKDHKGNIYMGNYIESSHKVVDIKDCLIASNLANRILFYIKQLIIKYKLNIFNERTMRGFLRHILIRVNKDDDQAMVVLVTGSLSFPKKKLFLMELLDAFPEIITIIQNINHYHTSMILGHKDIILYGKGYLEDELLNLKYHISSSSFYQINHKQTEKLYHKAIELCAFKGNELVLDAYCGIGTIGLSLAKYVYKVEAVEINKSAIKDAKINAKINKINNIDFYCDDAGKFMTYQAKNNISYDVVIVDPPRSGLDYKFIKALLKLKPKKIIYISCNPSTQARDIKQLSKCYNVNDIYPFDMFPFTNHIECITALQIKNNIEL